MKNKTYTMKVMQLLKRRLIVLPTLCCLLLFLGLWTTEVNAQASYSNNFNADATGWTGNITRTTATSACGSASMRRNLYSGATTGNMVSPSVGTSIAGLVTVTYKYKVANWSANTVGTPNPWGSFNVQYGPSATGPWTTFQTIDQTNHTVSGTCTTATAQFTPPAGPLFIKWDAFWTSGDYYLNFDDVTVSEVPITPCAGQPAPGNTIASASAVCSGSSVGLSLQNATTGTVVTYQWQESDDNSTWNNFGTNSPTASYTMGSTTKFFQCIVTCSNDPNPGISNSVQVDPASILACYCVAQQTSCSGDGITNVVLNTLSNPSTGCPGGGTNYTYFNPGVAATQLYIGQTYNIAITVQSDPSQFTNAWIDFNADGILDASEALSATTVNAGANGTANFSFTVPPSSATAVVRLRIRGGVDVTFTTAQACGINPSTTWGEVEDYDIELLPEPVCIDPPTAGAANSNITQFCNTSTVNLNLSLSGTSGGSGQTYQWQYSVDDVDYFNIGGATTPSWTENGVSISYYYRCNVTCGSSTVPSTSVFVEAVPPPSAGVISGPASAYASQAANYSSTGTTGSLQWIARLQPSTTWLVVPGGTNNPQDIFFGNPGTWEVRLVASVNGCTNDSSNIVSTVITIQNDNVCDAVPVNIGVNGPFTNVGATVEPGEASPPAIGCNVNNGWCIAGISNSVWFTFTVPNGGSGRYGIGFQPGNWDSQVAIYSAGACGDLLTGAATLIAANDDSSGSPYNSYIRAHCLTPGQTYYIQVDGYNTTTNSAFGLRIDDLGPANPSFSGIGATVCENAGLVTLTPAVAGGTFSGTGVTGNSFDPAAAAAGFHVITYTLGGLDTCYSSSQTVEVVTPTFTYYADADNDTYGNAGVSILSCEASAPAGYSADATDCDDTNPSINPGATEICNSIDDDCDGLTDEGFDVDGDNYTTCAGDCNDNDPSVYPGATEVCNGVDDDCNLSVDDGLTFITYYADADADTYGNAGSTVSTCNGAPSGYVSDNTDCDDNNAAVNPAATEICNGIDDNCNGLTDDSVPALPPTGSISGTATACLPGIAGTASFSVAPVVGATSYVWSVPASFIITGGQGTSSISVSYTGIAIQAGISGQMCVTVSNACVASAPSCVNIDYQIAAPVTPPSISGPGKVCPGDVVVYSISAVARATSYTWSVPGTMSIQSGQGTNVITVQVNPGYTGGTMSVIASNVCGNSAARTKTLTVNLPGTPTAIQGQKEGLCNTTGNIFYIPAVANATSYIWNVTGGTIMSGQGTTSITVDVATLIGSGSITVQAVNGCGTSLIRTLTISGAPGRAGVISGATSVCDNTNEAYSVATVPGAALYTWSVTANGSVSTGQGTKNITIDWLAPAAGQSMSVVTSNACGTSLTRTLTGITVNNCPRLGSAESNVFSIGVYPNPANDRVTIEFTAVENNDYRLRIADVTGRTLLMENGTAVTGLNTKMIPLNSFASGVYLVSIEMNNEQQQIKLIVE